MRKLFLFSALFLGMALYANQAHAVTIYVDWSNTGPVTNGTCWANAWTTISQGAADLAATNALVRGGHTVWVAAGTYNEQVDLGSTHSGAEGNRNTFLATNPAAVTITNSSAYAFRMISAAVSNLTIDGFIIRSAGTHGIYADKNLSYFTVQNCNIYECNRGMWLRYQSAGTERTIRNCTMYDNHYGVHIQEGGATVKNCIMLANRYRGIYEQDCDIALSNNLFYANGWGNLLDNDTCYDTAEEINNKGANSNNIVSNPGFINLYNRDFNAFYNNSPCIGAADDGGNLGAHQSPALTSVSSNIYYVATDGNDSRSKEQAQDTNTPWATIQKAASNAVAGDTVIIKAGTYYGDIVITNGGSGNLSVSFQGDGEVVVDGVTDTFGVRRVGDVIIRGIRLCAGNSQSINLNYAFAVSIIDMELEGRYGVLSGYSYQWDVDNCTIHGGDLAGVYSGDYSTGTIMRSRIYGQGHGVQFYASGQMNIYNCNIYSNTGYGIYDWNNSYFTAKNCDIYGNDLDGVYLEDYDSTIQNCIISSNSGYGIRERVGKGKAIATYNCFWGNATNFLANGTTGYDSAADINSIANCSNNIVANPRFKDVATNDFHITYTSPCINAGTKTSDLPTDMYGNPRVIGPACDIGSHEWQPPAGTIFGIR